MKIFRDPKLLFWLFFAITLAYLLVYAMLNSSAPLQTRNINIRVGSVVDYDALTPALNFSRRISGSYMAYSGGNFESWSRETYKLADSNASKLLVLTGDSNNVVYQDWVAVREASKQLSDTPYSNNDAIVQKTSLLSSLTQKLISDISVSNLGGNYYNNKGVL